MVFSLGSVGELASRVWPPSWWLAPREAAAAASARAAPRRIDNVEYYDVAVVGGGIVGLATAREIAGRYPSKTVCVLEKEADVGLHQTGHNSGVVHAGIHLTPGSMVARCVVRGNALMFRYCQALGLPYERVGKLICAASANETHHLTTLLERGRANGVQGLEILSAARVSKLEPRVLAHSALFSPNTGVADFGAVARRLAKDIAGLGNGSMVKLQFEVSSMELAVGDVYPAGRAVLIEGNQPGQPSPTLRVAATNVITCAGLQSDTVARMAGGDPDPKVVSFRGTYYQMKPEYRSICKMNVYPVPSGGGMPVGVHFTPTVNERRGRQMLVGPGASVCFDREAYRFGDASLRYLLDLATNVPLWKFAADNCSLATTEMYRFANKTAFMDQARKLIPSVTDDMVEESFSGVMSQVIEDDGRATPDFRFERNALDGAALNVRATRTCTAAFAIAEEIASMAAVDFGWGAERNGPRAEAPFFPTPSALAPPRPTVQLE